MTDQNNSLQEMQFIEQNLQNILMQKQAFQMEFAETQGSLKEIKDADDEVFKIIGQLMIKSDKKKIEEELKNKEKMIDLRIKSLENQETELSNKLTKLRDNFLNKEKKD